MSDFRLYGGALLNGSGVDPAADLIPIRDSSELGNGKHRKITPNELSLALSGSYPFDALWGHIVNYNNPHQTTKTQVGLGNVDNTSDINKPISIIQTAGLARKQISNIDTLRAISVTGLLANDSIETLGYYVSGDGGGGVFVYDGASIATDNGGTIIAPSGGGGRWLRVETEGPINAKTFGVRVGVNTDQAPAITAALTAAGERKVYFPAGIYKINSALALSQSRICMAGDGGHTVLDLSGGGTITAAIAPTSMPAISTDVAGGSNSMTFTSPHGLSVGDVVALYNPTDYSLSPHRVYYRDGCMFRVSAVVSSTVIRFFGVADKTYSAAAFTVWKIPGQGVEISGCKIIPPPTGTPLTITGHQGVRLDNIKILSGSDNIAILIDRCFDFQCNGLHSTVMVSTNSYPLAIANCQKGIIGNCSFYSTRHCITLGGGTGNACVPTRDVIIHDSILENDGTIGSPAADSHGNCIGIIYDSCILNFGGLIGGRDIAYLNCTIYGRPPNAFPDGFCVQGSETIGGTYRVEGCRLITYGNGVDYGAIYLGIEKITQDCTILIRNNTIINLSSNPSLANVVEINVGETAPPTPNITVIIEDLHYTAAVAGVAILWFVGSNDVSSRARIVVDNVTAPTGTPLVKIGAANLGIPMRLQRQSASQLIPTVIGAASMNGVVWTFRYPYPRIPTLQVSAGTPTGSPTSGATGGRPVISFLRASSNTDATPSLSSGDGAAFTSIVNIRAAITAEINEW